MHKRICLSKFSCELSETFLGVMIRADNQARKGKIGEGLGDRSCMQQAFRRFRPHPRVQTGTLISLQSSMHRFGMTRRQSNGHVRTKLELVPRRYSDFVVRTIPYKRCSSRLTSARSKKGETCPGTFKYPSCFVGKRTPSPLVSQKSAISARQIRRSLNAQYPAHAG